MDRRREQNSLDCEEETGWYIAGKNPGSVTGLDAINRSVHFDDGWTELYPRYRLHGRLLLFIRLASITPPPLSAIFFLGGGGVYGRCNENDLLREIHYDVALGWSDEERLRVILNECVCKIYRLIFEVGDVFFLENWVCYFDESFKD